MIQTTIQIDGMMCGMCEAHINDAIRNAFPVKKVSASRAKGEAVILSEAPIDADALTAVIQKTGYTPGAVKAEEAAPKKGLFGLFGKKK